MTASPLHHQLIVRRTFKASRERVFEAWSNPELLKVWLGGQTTQVLHATVDFSVGGMYQLDIQDTSGNIARLSGMYQEIESPRRIVFTWEWGENYSASSATLVTIELREVDNTTEIVLKHERFDDVPTRDSHGKGWAMCFDRLTTLIST